MPWTQVTDYKLERTYVIPDDDLVEHQAEDEDCVCGPSIECLPVADGADWWMITHHALDGRE